MSTTGQAPFYGSVADVLARPGWSSISAIQNNRVVIVSGELFVQAGPRIGEQIAVAAEAFYPELFNSP
jgi:iron complex transport system substrate-binding protein